MVSTPMTSAVTESPGIPKTRAGTHAPASAELFAAVESAIASREPLPYSSGLLENLFEMAFETQAAMSAPAPGSMPMSEPMLLERRKWKKRPEKVWRAGEKVSRMAPRWPLAEVGVICGVAPLILRRTSEMPKRPIIAGMNSIPLSSWGTPKVKRGSLWTALRPMVEISSPMTRASAPLSDEPRETSAAQLRPSR